MSDEFDRKISISDYCHFNPSRWSHKEYGNNESIMKSLNVARNACEQCIYNQNRFWEDSYCDYPKKKLFHN